jgi:hypothetical protein
LSRGRDLSEALDELEMSKYRVVACRAITNIPSAVDQKTTNAMNMEQKGPSNTYGEKNLLKRSYDTDSDSFSLTEEDSISEGCERSQNPYRV